MDTYSVTETSAVSTEPSTLTGQSQATTITGRDVATLVMGIISLYLIISGMLPVIGYLFSLILGIIGAVLGVRARKDTRMNNKALATAGLICSSIGIVLSVILLIVSAVVAALAGVALFEMSSIIPEAVNSIANG
ncbi:DUF4190 domain-containing protein [Ruminococcaceae bacterium OttesenSCG-928-I18]|nr:DUF4190 domain-containing protein [Ruminococcaceae bacterium OttesenSCG-928-I18]